MQHYLNHSRMALIYICERIYFGKEYYNIEIVIAISNDQK